MWDDEENVVGELPPNEDNDEESESELVDEASLA